MCILIINLLVLLITLIITLIGQLHTHTHTLLFKKKKYTILSARYSTLSFTQIFTTTIHRNNQFKPSNPFTQGSTTLHQKEIRRYGPLLNSSAVNSRLRYRLYPDKTHCFLYKCTLGIIRSCFLHPT